MSNAFLVLGYGIPENILEDEDYNGYLHDAAKTIGKNRRPLVILSGGLTDLFAPYKRSEAEEMRRFLKEKLSKKSWRFICEKKSLSTLENLIYSKKLLDHENDITTLEIFFEKSRSKRIRALAKKVFAGKIKLHFHPLNFGKTESSAWTSTKETWELKLAFWALESKRNFQSFRALYTEKFRLLREEEWLEEELRAWWLKSSRALLGLPDKT